MKSRWIPVSKGLPEDPLEPVDAWMEIPPGMLMGDSLRVPDAYYKHGRWCHIDGHKGWRDLRGDYITHWREVPKPPAEERGGALETLRRFFGARVRQYGGKR